MNTNNKISGWYYDLQLKNRLTSASLHPNRVLSEDQSDWNPIEGEKDPDYTDEGKNAYAKDPICRAIITEDFNVSVANTWSDFGGDMLGQMWESIKPLAPYASTFKQMISDAVADYRNPKNKERLARIKESKVSSTMADIMISLDNKLNDPNSGIDITDYLNRALVVQGTRFSYYSGSGTSFGNLMMKFTIFPTYDGTEYKSVDSQISKILPYCIGKFVSGTDGLNMNSSETQKMIDSMIGWQKPPGGFKANVKNVDVIQEGTLMLRFGAYYSIPNLVVENANFNFSKQMTKNPETSKISPLYCDVAIQLRPATKYSDNSLKDFVLSRRSTKIIEEVEKDMDKKLFELENITDYVY